MVELYDSPAAYGVRYVVPVHTGLTYTSIKIHMLIPLDGYAALDQHTEKATAFGAEGQRPSYHALFGRRKRLFCAPDTQFDGVINW